MQEEDFKKREGRGYTADELLGATLVGIASFKLEKFVDMQELGGMKLVTDQAKKALSKLPPTAAGIVAKNALVNLARVSTGGLGEAGQELLQGYGEELNKYNLFGDDVKPMTDMEHMDMAKQAATGMLAAPGSSALIMSPTVAGSTLASTAAAVSSIGLPKTTPAQANAPVVAEPATTTDQSTVTDAAHYDGLAQVYDIGTRLQSGEPVTIEDYNKLDAYEKQHQGATDTDIVQSLKQTAGMKKVLLKN